MIKKRKKQKVYTPDVKWTVMFTIWKDWLLYGNSNYPQSCMLKWKCKIKNTKYEQQKKQWFYSNPYHNYIVATHDNTYFYPKWLYRHVEKCLYKERWDLWLYMNVDFSWDLFGRQEKIINKAIENRSSLLVSPTGSWKSFIIMWLINKTKMKTLVVVPTQEIMKWLYNKFTEFLDCKIWRIWAWHDDIQDITIIISASFNNKWQELNWKFSQLIFDEAHEWLTSQHRIYQMCLFRCDRLYGLTATPERDDIDIDWFSIIYWEIIDSWIEVVKPDITYILYNNPSWVCLDWQDKLDHIYSDPERLENQAGLVHDIMELWRSMWLVLVWVKEQARELVKLINKEWCFAMEYTGDVKSEDRDWILKEVEKNKWVMVATYQTVGTGFDYPALDTCFYYCPVKFQGRVKQAVGRILRKKEWKNKPLLVDWTDKIIQYQGYSRHRLYDDFFDTKAIPIKTRYDFNFLRG